MNKTKKPSGNKWKQSGTYNSNTTFIAKFSTLNKAKEQDSEGTLAE